MNLPRPTPTSSTASTPGLSTWQPRALVFTIIALMSVACFGSADAAASVCERADELVDISYLSGEEAFEAARPLGELAAESAYLAVNAGGHRIVAASESGDPGLLFSGLLELETGCQRWEQDSLES